MILICHGKGGGGGGGDEGSGGGGGGTMLEFIPCIMLLLANGFPGKPPGCGTKLEA